MLVNIAPKSDLNENAQCLAPWLAPLMDAARTGSSIIGPLQNIVKSLGFDSFLYAVGTGECLHHDERFYLWTTVPPEWVAEYDRESYVEIDPRVTYGWSTWQTPLVWDHSIAGNEPPRDSRRLHFLRRWSHEYIKEIFAGSARACGSAGL